MVTAKGSIEVGVVYSCVPLLMTEEGGELTEGGYWSMFGGAVVWSWDQQSLSRCCQWQRVVCYVRVVNEP